MARSKPSKQANKRTTTTTSASRNASVSLPSSTPADDTQDDFANMSTSSSSAIEDSILESHEEEEDGADVDTPTGARSRSPAPRDITLEDEDEEILTSGSKPSQSNVVVCVRVRPASPSATSTSDPWKLSQESSTIEATENHPSLAKRAPSSAPGLAASSSSSFLADKPQATASGEKDAYKYTFDSILPPTSSDLSALYKAHISPVVCGAVQGYNGTVFAYGQTGSGKTYTMSGGGSDPGIIGRAINEVFECVGRDPSREFLLRVSYLEIYNETLRDLLASLPSSSSVAEGLQPSASSSSTVGNRPASPTKGGYSHQAGGGSALRIQEHPASGRITISGLREEVVTSSADITSLLERGQAARHQAATDWNERSSRSHCVATLTIESRRKEGADGVRVSALNLIDLAGSERAASEKERRKEGAFINKSLLTLGSVISKLSTAANNPAAAAHVPYRDSKLTRLLQTSLSGNARVAVLLTLSPLPQHAIEGLSTLKFGRRCKMIKLRARRGEVREGDGSSEALLKRYKREVERLRAKLDSGADNVGGADDAQMKEIEERRRAAASEVEGMARQKAELRAQMEHLTKLILTGKSVVHEDDDMPGTPTRPRARVSEVGTPGTPSRSRPGSMSPRKRTLGASSLRSSSESFSITGQEVSDTSDSKPFAAEAMLATLRRNLENALAAKSRAEELLETEVASWQQRVASLKDTLDKKEQEWKRAERVIEGRGQESRHHLEKELEQLRMAVEKSQKETGDREKELAEVQAEAASQRASLRGDIERLQAEVEMERHQRRKAEETLAKRPETDEEQVQSEFDELVKSARAEEELKSPRMTTLGNLSPRSKERAGKKHSSRQEELDQKERDLTRRAEALAAKEASALLMPKCDHLYELEAMRKELDDHRDKVASLNSQLQEKQNASHGATSSVPSSPSKLRETLSATATPKGPRSFTALARGGSVREYRRYPGPMASSPSTSPSMSSSASFLPALSLASTTANAQSSALLEASLRREREEVMRLNEVIQGQRTIMSDLEKSVAEWQLRMKEQQEIIRMLMEDGGPIAADAQVCPQQIPTPPMSEGENAPLTPTRATKRVISRSLRSTPLRSSGRNSNGATPPKQQGKPLQGSEDFMKRRNMFAADSAAAGLPSKQRGGSAFPLGASTGPYYGAHTFNRPPTTIANPGLGLTAPNSPTKGSGLWGSGPSSGPDPLPLPGSLTPNAKRRQRRITIEHELEALKNGNSPRVDERTRGLLDSPTKKAVNSSGLGGGEKASRNWYI